MSDLSQKSDKWLKDRYIELLGKRKQVLIEYGLKQCMLAILGDAVDNTSPNQNACKELVQSMDEKYWTQWCPLMEEEFRVPNWFSKENVIAHVHSTGHMEDFMEYDSEARSIHAELCSREIHGFQGRFQEHRCPDPDPSSDENDFHIEFDISKYSPEERLKKADELMALAETRQADANWHLERVQLVLGDLEKQFAKEQAERNRKYAKSLVERASKWRDYV